MTTTPETISADFWATFDRDVADARIEHGPRKTDHEIYLEIYGRTLGGAVRRQATDRIKQTIRQQQNNHCLYCEEPIGSLVLRRTEPVELRTAWDHFVPFQYASANRATNWVLACHVCNGVKHAKIFETLAEAQRFINARWYKLGYERIDPELQQRLRAAG